jgi:hypothetical protein
MAVSTRENSKMGRSMEKEFMSGPMVASIQEDGNKICYMVTASTNGRMVEIIKESG